MFVTDKLCSLWGRNWTFDHHHLTFRGLTIQQQIGNRSKWYVDIKFFYNLKQTTKLVIALVHDRRLDLRGQWHAAEAETVLPAYPVLQIGEPPAATDCCGSSCSLSQTPSPSHTTCYKLLFSLCQHELGRRIKRVPHTPDIRLVLKNTFSWNRWAKICEFIAMYCRTPI